MKSDAAERTGPFAPVRVAAALVVALMWASTSVMAATTVTVSGQQILVNGQPLTIRGICYQPTPIGGNPSQSPPWGDYYTLSYRALYERDLPQMRRMGANVIRVYSWDHQVSHGDFLNKVYGDGSDPIYVLLNRWIDPNSDWSNRAVVEAIKNDYLAMVANITNHPAVLGFIIGNELNRANGGNTNFWAAVNTIAQAIKAQAPGRLVTTSLGEGVSQIAQVDGQMSALDAWSLQIFRGRSFGDLFSTYQVASAKPMLISEFGMDAMDNTTGQLFPANAQLVADIVQGLWREMRTNQTIVSGGCVFCYSDEWWKGGSSASIHEMGGFVNSSFPDGFSNEEWYGIFGVADNGVSPDLLQLRALSAKLEALWAIPRTTITASFINGRLQSQFFVPGGRDDLKYELEVSGDMNNWRVIMRINRDGPGELIDYRAFLYESISRSTGDRTVIVLNPLPGPTRSGGAIMQFNRLKITRY